MALKNTYLTKHAGYYIQLAQEALIKGGASGVQFGYELKRTIALAFTLEVGGKDMQFKLPINWRKFQVVLKREGLARALDDEYAYRVAWACTKDWIEAQMAFVESESVSIPQVFLPYAVTKGGETLFEKIVANPQFLLE